MKSRKAKIAKWEMRRLKNLARKRKGVAAVIYRNKKGRIERRFYGRWE